MRTEVRETYDEFGEAPGVPLRDGPDMDRPWAGRAPFLDELDGDNAEDDQ